MTVLGIDPGYAILGYGIIEVKDRQFRPLDYGVIETSAEDPFPERLEKLYTGTKQLLMMFKPGHVVFEELFFYRNTTTALQVSAGRGVALLAAQQSGVPLYEYTPMQIKLSVTGDGHADKKQVQRMIQILLQLKSVPKPDDAADALAAALCHANTMGPAMEQFRIR